MTKLRVTIDSKEQDKIWWYVDKCKKEISGLGKIIKKEDGTLHVNKIYLLEQECSATETELDDNAVASLLYETREDEGSLIFWWHSHVDMDVFWSKTDMDTIYQLGNSGIIVSTVFNKKRESRTSVYLAEQELNPAVFVDDLELEVVSCLTEEELEDLEAEYENKVSFKTYTYPTTTWQPAKPWTKPVKQDEESADFTGNRYKSFADMTVGETAEFKLQYKQMTGFFPTSDSDCWDDFMDFCDFYMCDLTSLEADGGIGYFSYIGYTSGSDISTEV